MNTIPKAQQAVKQRPKRARAGQYWYVKFSGATSLVLKYVVDATPLTVALSDLPYTAQTRYKLDDIEMVERKK